MLKGEKGYLKRFIKVVLVLIVVFTLFYTAIPVRCDPAAILKVSLPDGVYVGFNNDPWLSECWLLNMSGRSQSFSLMINNTSRAKRSYDTHLIIALNDAGYQNLESLIINGTEVPKSAFRYGKPKPYGIWDWPSGDVYPTWFNDTIINVGTIPRKGFVTLIVSVTFSNASGVRIHFDAYGSKVYPPPPTKKGDITHNSLSQDSTVLLQVGPPPPQPPLASFTYTPTYPETHEVVTFNATQSYDPDGYIVQYTWDFGDGNITSISDPIVTHTYEIYGEFNVTLTIMDDDGLTDQATATLYVSQRPVASFTFSPSDPLVHEVVTFNASASTPDGGVLVSYTWDFGDGNITSTSDPIVTHAYSTYGTYTVTLNVTDSEGKWDATSKTIVVEAVPIADFFWSPYYPQRYENVTFDASISSPDGGTIIKYVWNFGDGSPIVEETDPITFHIYTDVGNYTVTLNVTDSEGRWDTVSKIVTVVPRRFYLEVATVPESITTIPGEGWYDEGTSVNLTAPDVIVISDVMRYVFAYWDVDGVPQDAGMTDISVLMDANHTATAYYLTQYKLIVKTNGLGTYVTNVYNGTAILGTATDTAPYIGWFDEGVVIYLNVDSPITDSSERKVFNEWSGDAVGTDRPFTLIMNSAKNITANYKTQFLVVFMQTGLDNTATSTVITVNSVNYGFADLPYSVWANESSTFTYLYQDVVSSSTAGKRFKLVNVSGPASPFTVSCPVTVTGNYKVQYQVTFDKTGLDSSATGTIVTVNGTSLDYASLPFSQWLDEGVTVTYSYETIVSSSTQGKRFSLSNVTGPVSPFTVDGPKTVVGNYVIQYYLTVQVDPSGITTISGEGWYDESETVALTAPSVTGYDFSYWDIDGISQGAGVNPINILMDKPHTATAHYQAVTPQYTLTIVTTTGGTTNPAPGSYTYDEGTVVSVTAIPEANYKFDHWELDGGFYSNESTVDVTMDSDHELKAFFEYVPPLSVSIEPSSATIDLGDSILFNATASGGVPPYSYQWYLNGNPVPGANSSTWNFKPASSGIYYIYVAVTDSEHNTAQSSTARVIVRTPTVGGPVFPVKISKSDSPLLSNAVFLVFSSIFLAMIFYSLKKSRKRRN